MFEVFKHILLYCRVKKEHADYFKKKVGTGGGPPPSSPTYRELEEAAISMESELLPMEDACDSLNFSASPGQDTLLGVDSRDVGKNHLLLYSILSEYNVSPIYLDITLY